MLQRVRPGAPPPVEAFKRNGADFVVATTLAELVEGMNRLTPHAPLDLAQVEKEVVARDREVDNAFTKDLQIAALRSARAYRGDKLIRVATPHKLLDPAAGPLIAVRLHVITRKTLGRPAHRPGRTCPRGGRRAAARPVRRRRGGRLRRRRHARLPLARGHVPRRLHLLRPRRRPGGGRRHRLSPAARTVGR